MKTRHEVKRGDGLVVFAVEHDSDIAEVVVLPSAEAWMTRVEVDAVIAKLNELRNQVRE